MTTTRDTISERIFQDWLDERALKYQGLTFKQYKQQVLDTVPEEKRDEHSGSSIASDVNPGAPAEELGPWKQSDGTDETGVRPSPVQEALGTDTGAIER